MKLTYTLAVLALGLAISTVPCRAACSNATFNGAYGFLLTGVDGSTLIATVGQIISDGNGNITGTETVSIGGSISSNLPFSGTYSVKSNCTGTAVANASGLPTAHLSMTVVSSGKQADIMQTDTGTNVYGYALARGNAVCTLAGTKGTYGFDGGGFNSPTLPNAFQGVVSFDGAGNLSGTETASSAGSVTTAPISGTYSINSDCTGSASVLFNGQTSTTNFVVANGGQTVLEIKTNATAVTLMLNKR